jgi:hypothetical protein
MNAEVTQGAGTAEGLTGPLGLHELQKGSLAQITDEKGWFTAYSQGQRLFLRKLFDAIFD